MPWVQLQRPRTASLFTGTTTSRVTALAGTRRRAVLDVRRFHASPGSSKDAVRPPYKVLFAGSDRFSCIPFQYLLNAPDVVDEVHVLVSPDKRVSRGLKQVYRPPLRTLAEKCGIPVHVLPKTGIKDWQVPEPFFSSSSKHLLITAAFGQLVPTRVLDHFLPMNTINIHPSLLPKYRGAAPIQWAIMHGEKKTGVTIQTLSRGVFDHGEILAQESSVLEHRERYLHAEARLADIGGRLLVDTLRRLEERQARARKQDDSLASQARKLTSDDAQIDDWRFMSASAVLRKQDGLSHQFPIWTTFLGKRVQMLEVGETDLSLDHTWWKPGECRLDGFDGSVIVTCGDGEAVKVGAFKTEGRSVQQAHRWWQSASKHGSEVVLGT